LGAQGFQAEVIHDRQGYSRQGLEAAVITAGRPGGLQKEHLIALLNGTMSQRLGERRFAGTAWPGNQDSDFFADKASGCQVLDESPVQAGIEIEVKLLESFGGAETGSPSP
jgi:hypothetical protein